MGELVFVGRKDELQKIEGLRGISAAEFGQAKGLHFIGAPKIGKTALLQQAFSNLRSYDKEGPPFLCPVFVEWRPGPTFALWNSIWRQINDFVTDLTQTPDGSQVYDAVQKAIKKYREAKEQQRPRFLTQLKGLSKELRIVFLLDDFDKALQTIYQGDERTMKPQEFVKFARDEPELVKLVVTSRHYRVDEMYQLHGLIGQSEWLQLLTKEEAYELAGSILDREPEDPLLEPIVEWAGYHPYYIRTLASSVQKPASPRSIREAIEKWRVNEELQQHLNELWDYLDLRRYISAVLVLQRISPKGIPREALERAGLTRGINYLIERAVVAEVSANSEKHIRVPARIFRDFARRWISLPAEEKWYVFTWRRLFKLVLLSLFVSTFMTFLGMIGWRPFHVLLVRLDSRFFALGLPCCVALVYILWGWLRRDFILQ